ncbi:hypothetical protein P3102_29290 [Amycolatopsis sp. QT-25]|uniref:hypothetical protein n=1 Tax=Amycolatopsis sp. QT-25 TaxID=3034022 RepID=UPI0023EBF032|nr:hypothetical protein [Amycolatopsis sp. QT-25]WET78129.1 hypothetical protein P3102_29290 [Amycolatopsis sp. QT-25]
MALGTGERPGVTHTGYFSPVSAAGDFREVTAPVLEEALRKAETAVLERSAGGR